ncbi:hypothetical protein [Cryobacterium sp. GrIS_2_6]|uniref:hypothetical protein n=1 Tax=Cryobacterium sp. GrIS_2_6 TaxID=3162785 RepID=UPI002DFD56EE|nr:hypothetical protein [Cryobacterium psychrotolerans]
MALWYAGMVTGSSDFLDCGLGRFQELEENPEIVEENRFRDLARSPRCCLREQPTKPPSAKLFTKPVIKPKQKRS